ncbi:hypothetical protein SK128_012825 [Halocaridina rubra]|uniref:DNA polymerase n=1 Tax=Halocaridina rubra TaxID=373956 RepID=A0AAN8WVY0_HALRR
MVPIKVSPGETQMFDNTECWYLNLSKDVLRNMDDRSPTTKFPRLCCKAALFSSIIGRMIFKDHIDGKRLFYMTRLFHHAITNAFLPGKLSLAYPQFPIEKIKERERAAKPVRNRTVQFPVLSPSYAPVSPVQTLAHSSAGQSSPSYAAVSPVYGGMLYVPTSPVPDYAQTGWVDVGSFESLGEGIYQTVLTLHMNDVGNMEDGIIVNKSAIQRGLFMHTERRVINFAVGNCNIIGKARDSAITYIDADGVLKIGSVVSQRVNVLVNSIRFGMDREFNVVTYDAPLLFSETHKLCGFKLESQTVSFTNVKMTFTKLHSATEGDKLTSRHGQKGVICQVRRQENMPFNSKGQSPDIIINSNSTIKRLSLGVYEELKLSSDTGQEMNKELTFSGETGCNIGYHEWGFLSYLALDQIAVKKKYICIPTETNRQIFTGQPKEGRSQEGGFRVGVLEVASIRASGSLQFLRDRLLKNSDEINVLICSSCRLLQHNECGGEADQSYCIILAYNLCPSTFLSESEAARYSPDSYCTIVNDDKRYRFLKKEVKEGYLPSLVSQLLADRKTTKSQMARANGVERVVLDKRQTAFKLMANSVYGVMASCITSKSIGFEPVAASITAVGRSSVVKAQLCIDDVLKGRGKVFYGDTDSCYVALSEPGLSVEGAQEIGRWIEKTVHEMKVFPSPMYLSFEEDVHVHYILLAKKRYLYTSLSGDGIKSKGTMLARRSQCKIIKEIYTNVIQRIFDGDVSLEDTLTFIADQFKGVRQRSVDDFVCTVGINMNTKTVTPQQELYRRMVQRKEHLPVHRMQYVVIGMDNLIYETKNYIVKNDVEICYGYYERFLLNPLLQLLKIVFGADFNQKSLKNAIRDRTR